MVLRLDVGDGAASGQLDSHPFDRCRKALESVLAVNQVRIGEQRRSSKTLSVTGMKHKSCAKAAHLPLGISRRASAIRPLRKTMP